MPSSPRAGPARSALAATRPAGSDGVVNESKVQWSAEQEGRRRPVKGARRAGGALLAGLVLAACAETTAPPAPDPVFVFGVDGFEWSVILPLLRHGRMPNLEALMERGTYGRLATMMPNQSPRLWTTMATGKAPEEHGILGFVKVGADGAESADHYTGADRTTKAFWNILSERGISNDTIGWWMTYPVEEVAGVMVAQTNTLDSPTKKGGLVVGQRDQVWPPEREAQVLARLDEIDEGLEDVIREIFGARAGNDSRNWRKCRWVFRADSTYVSVLRSLLEERGPASVTTIFLGGTDVVGHRFWDVYRPDGFSPRAAQVKIDAEGHVIPTYYEYVDRVLGEFLALLPENTRVLVISDHGMRTPPPGTNSERYSRGYHDGDTPGAFLAAGPGFRNLSSTPAAEVRLGDLETLGQIADVCPTLLAAVGLPYGEDMLGRPLSSLFTDEFLDQHPLTSIPTHDDAAWLAARPQAIVHEDPERLEQLRKLGYLGDQDE